MNKGWVKLHRDILDWEWYKRPNIVSVFIHCLLRANHKDKKWQGTLIKRGQFVTSYKNLSNELSGKQAGLTVMQVRTAISKLKLTGEITTKSTNKYTIITVNNYDRYQQDNNQDNNQITNKQQTNNKQITTNKNIKNIKNEEKDTQTSKIKNQTKEIINYWNETKNGQLKSINPYKKNLKYWLDGGYTLDDVKEAIDKIEVGLDWANEPDLELLLRQRDRSQQPVDRIGRCLSAEKKDGDSKVLT